MGTFIDNHDVPRLINGMVDFKEERMKQALTFLMTYTGIPMMYYGTEIGMEGGGDPDNRRDMDWNAKSPLREYVKKLTGIRKENKALTKGDISVIRSDGDGDVLCYSRRYEKDGIIVVYNLSTEEKQVKLDLFEDNEDYTLVNLLSGERYPVAKGLLDIKMSPKQSMILKAELNNKTPS